MNPATHIILEKLARADFAYPVAIYEGNDFELGPVLYADAFDVPEGPIIQVSEQLNEVLGWIDSTPLLLPGVYFDCESAEKRSELPPDTIWYAPATRSHISA